MRIDVYHNTLTDLIEYFQKHRKDIGFHVSVTPQNILTPLVATMKGTIYHVQVKDFQLTDLRYKVELHIDKKSLRVWVGERRYKVLIDFLKEKRKSLKQWIRKEEATFHHARVIPNPVLHSFSLGQTFIDVPVDFAEAINDFDILEQTIESILSDLIQSDIRRILSGDISAEHMTHLSPSRAYEQESDDLTFHMDDNHDVKIIFQFKERI